MNQATIDKVPLFDSVSKRRRRQLTSLADEIDIPAGAELIRQGGYALEFFIVLEGSADVYRDGRHVGTLGPGDFFGEVGLLKTAWLRIATVVTTSPMRLLVVGRREFQTMIDAFPSIAGPILQAAAARAKATQLQGVHDTNGRRRNPSATGRGTRQQRRRSAGHARTGRHSLRPCRRPSPRLHPPTPRGPDGTPSPQR